MQKHSEYNSLSHFFLLYYVQSFNDIQWWVWHVLILKAYIRVDIQEYDHDVHPYVCLDMRSIFVEVTIAPSPK